MYDACNMGAAEGLGYLDCVFCSHIRGHTPGWDKPVQGLPGDVLHHHVVDAVLGTDVMNDTDVRVLEAGNGFCLLHETCVQVGAG